jgi:phage tail protein X
MDEDRTMTIFRMLASSVMNLRIDRSSVDWEIAMKNRISFVVLGVLVVLAGLVWMVAKDQRGAIKTAEVTTAVPIVVPVAEIRPAASIPVLSGTPVVSAAPQLPVVQPDPIILDDPTKHVAKAGETVSSLATNLLGKDSKTNRDAIIDANSSLQANPDKLIAGKAYHIPQLVDVQSTASVAVPAPVPTPAAVVPVETVQSQPTKVLKYTAAKGDTVSKLAGAFLGNDDQAHQDSIVNANPSLQADPDQLVAGKAYRIPAPDGLSAAAVTASSKTSARPTSQPDEDQVISANSPRALRYTAVAGDTVTTLAIELLGSDTPEARDAIINNNPALKANPDRIVAGQTYWIPAPTAAVDLKN